MHNKIILASSSPRRLQLLEAAGFSVCQLNPNIDELILAQEGVRDAAQRLSQEKAIAIGVRDLPIVAADTIVEIHGLMLGKPVDSQEAQHMLRRLADNWHEVWTGFTVVFKGTVITEAVCTRVKFRSLTDREIELYIQAEKPFDKAGSYGIQNSGSSLIDSIDGSLTNVMGLPLAQVVETLETLGFHV